MKIKFKTIDNLTMFIDFSWSDSTIHKWGPRSFFVCLPDWLNGYPKSRGMTDYSISRSTYYRLKKIAQRKFGREMEETFPVDRYNRREYPEYKGVLNLKAGRRELTDDELWSGQPIV